MLTGLESECLRAARSQFLHLMGVSAGQLTGYGSEHFLQPLRRNIDPWLCLWLSYCFLFFDSFPFFLHILTSLVKCTLWDAEKPGSLKVSYRQEAGRGHAMFSFKI